MKRLEAWESLLFKHLESIGPFEWGSNDCCMFAVGCVEAITGVNFGSEYVGYSTKFGASKVLYEHGGVDGIATKHLGEPKQSKLAKRGDIVMFDCGDGNALGVCLGVKIAAVSESGLMFISMNKAIKAWSV